MNITDLRSLIQNILKPIGGLYTLDAEEILVATCAQESHLGFYRKQISGPACGIWQMEPEDHDDIWDNFLRYHAYLTDQAKSLSQLCTADDLVNNDPYACLMARIHYLRKPGILPVATDLEGIWAYYKKNYNSMQGAAQHDDFIANYNKYVLGQ